jgi:DNA-binding NtrC family response regulator
MVGKYRILVIDDDDIIRETLGGILEEEGYIVDTAKDGKEAIAKSNANFYNLAIVDWRLPDTEGTKLLGNLRETTPRMAKIMLTGYPSMQNAVDSVNAKADAFFPKPAKIEPLLEKIKELLKEQEQARKYSEEKMVEYIETRVKELTPAKNITV